MNEFETTDSPKGSFLSDETLFRMDPEKLERILSATQKLIDTKSGKVNPTETEILILRGLKADAVKIRDVLNKIQKPSL